MRGATRTVPELSAEQSAIASLNLSLCLIRKLVVAIAVAALAGQERKQLRLFRRYVAQTLNRFALNPVLPCLASCH
jgi:hypothetical protein